MEAEATLASLKETFDRDKKAWEENKTNDAKKVEAAKHD